MNSRPMILNKNSLKPIYDKPILASVSMLVYTYIFYPKFVKQITWSTSQNNRGLKNYCWDK